MTEHKLLPEEIKKTENAIVIDKTIVVICTKMTDTWVTDPLGDHRQHYFFTYLKQTFCCAK